MQWLKRSAWTYQDKDTTKSKSSCWIKLARPSGLVFFLSRNKPTRKQPGTFNQESTREDPTRTATRTTPGSRPEKCMYKQIQNVCTNMYVRTKKIRPGLERQARIKIAATRKDRSNSCSRNDQERIKKGFQAWIHGRTLRPLKKLLWPFQKQPGPSSLEQSGHASEGRKQGHI